MKNENDVLNPSNIVYESVLPNNPTNLKRTQVLLQSLVEGAESVEEIRKERFGEFLTFPQIEEYSNALTALEEIANEPPDEVSLYELVEWYGNAIVNESTMDITLNPITANDPEKLIKANEIAQLWLFEFAEFMRDTLRDVLRKKLGVLFQEDNDEDMPARKYPVIVTRPRKYFFPEV
jgi:hypothetical protein